MPTAARLVAALCLAVVAFVLSGQIIPLLPESTYLGNFVPINVVLGALCGWFVMGKRAGRGITAGINNGLTGVFVLILWGLAVWASYEMFDLAMKNRYDNAFEAVIAIFQIAAEYGAIMFVSQIGITFVVGAVISGLLTEFASRKWR